jgi:hypothetical protein
LVKGDFVFAVPGDLDTPTGGYAYDKRMIAELRELGWRPQVLNFGEGFPHPNALTRATAKAQLNDVPKGRAIVIDGLAFGVMPDEAEALSQRHPLIAMVHHPLALERGVTPQDQAEALRESERKRSLVHPRGDREQPHHRMLLAGYGVPAERITVAQPGTDRVSSCRAITVARRAAGVGSLVPRKGYDVLIEALATSSTCRGISPSWARRAIPRLPSRCGRQSSGTSSGRVLRSLALLRHRASPSFTPYRTCSCCRRGTRVSAWRMRRRSRMGFR